jgi:hypothetical protein
VTARQGVSGASRVTSLLCSARMIDFEQNEGDSPIQTSAREKSIKDTTGAFPTTTAKTTPEAAQEGWLAAWTQ